MTDELIFLSHAETLDLLSPAEAMAVCEDVYRMHAEGTVSWTEPPAFRLDDDRFHHHWHVKGALLSKSRFPGFGSTPITRMPSVRPSARWTRRATSCFPIR